MDRKEIERVLANWIAQAGAPSFASAAEVTPEAWIAERFVDWFASQTSDSLSDAEAAVSAIRSELMRLGGWNNPDLGETLHELAHVSDALSELHVALGVEPAGQG
jgi:hypothetical protein